MTRFSPRIQQSSTLCCTSSALSLENNNNNNSGRHSTPMYRTLTIVRSVPRLARSSRLLSTSVVRHKDPWPLPHTPEHLAYTASSPDTPPPQPLPRPGETVETMRARLVYQSRKRGTLESDLLLSTFAKEELGQMNEAELKEFDKVCPAFIIPS